MIIGWREFVGLPDLGLSRIKAKIDTGARTSALHAFRVEEFEEHGVTCVRFWMHPLRKHREIELECKAPIVDRRVVSDSGGHRERRIVIRTTVRIGDHSWPIEVTLTDRDSMIFPMLLGRTAMENRLVVDPSKSYTLGREAGNQFKTALLRSQRP